MNTILMKLEGKNGQLVLFDDRIEITRSGFVASINHSQTNLISINLLQISTIQIKECSKFYPGYLRIVITGGTETELGLLERQSDIYTVIYGTSDPLAIFNSKILNLNNQWRQFKQKALDQKNIFESQSPANVQEQNQSHNTVDQSLGNLDQYNRYKSLTEKHDWEGICNINKINWKSTNFGTKKEFQRLPTELQPSEVVFCFTSGIIPNSDDSNLLDFGISSWLIVLTDRRFLFLDSALLTKSIDTHSILHKNVQGVRVAQGFVLGKISIDTGGRTTLIDNCEKNSIKIFGDLANNWLQVLEERKTQPQSSNSLGESGLDKLRKLGELKALGVLSDDEFNAAKTKLLTSI